MNIQYQLENTLNVDEFIDVLKRSTLAERRPVDDREKMTLMCRFGNLVITARVDGILIGVARSVSDFAFCTYLSELAVDVQYQGRGVGTRLIRETKKHAASAKLILLSAPAAVGYYPKIGMKRHEHCYVLDDIEDLTDREAYENR